MSKNRLNQPTCPNCEAELPDHANFCPNCGQENHTHTVPFGHLMYEFVESITHFDHKLWATLKAIVLKPGQFVIDFVNDRRARYVPPARLYVFVSVIFFLLVNKVTDKGLADDQAGEQIYGVYGEEADFFTLKGVLGTRFTQQKDLKEVRNVRLYYDKRNDPAARIVIGRLKQLSVAQVDSMMKAQQQEDDSYPAAAAKLRQGIAYLPAQLPRRFVPGTSDTLLVELDDILEDRILAGIRLRYAADIRIPFSGQDSTGRASLAAVKKSTEEGLLRLYGISYHVIPEIRDSVAAEMKRLAAALPNSYDLKDARSELGPSLNTAFGYNLSFGNDSTMKAELRLARFMSDEQLIQLIERRTGKSLEYTSWWKKSFVLRSIRQAAKLNVNESHQRNDVVKELVHTIIKYTSWVMFFLMPVVAFVLLVIYFRKRKFYYEHLIFSVHTHTVFFIILSLGLVITYYSDLDIILMYAFGLGYLYLLLALKRTYGQGWIKTILKFTLFTTIYGFLFIGFTLISTLIGFLNF